MARTSLFCVYRDTDVKQGGILMKRKRWLCAALALALLLAGAERLTRDRRDVQAACAYLQSQKYDESDPEAIPARSDPTKSNPAGRVLSMQSAAITILIC